LLTKLHIKNIAVIDEVEIDFSKGFNVMTGETGAGKSIIIDSINMILGKRVSHDIIRSGEKKAVVEAVFTVDEGTSSIFEEYGIDTSDGEIIIYRDLNIDGRSTMRVNGMMVTASAVRDFSSVLIDIHGQHDNQALLVSAKHIDFLDKYAETTEQKEEYVKKYRLVKEIEEKIAKSTTDATERERRLELLKYQINEIETAKLKKNEDEELIEQRNFLGGAEKISEAVSKSVGLLYSGEYNIHDMLSDIAINLRSVISYDKRLEEVYNIIESANIELDDASYQLRDYIDGIDFDSSSLDEVEARLDTINNLKRKYGSSIEEILIKLEQMREEAEQTENNEKYLDDLRRELEKTKGELEKSASKLADKRKKAAAELEKGIHKELSDLDMSGVKFSVSFEECEYTANGNQKIEFTISTNPGEPLKPLSKIASGGELSRIMLAIKSHIAETDNVETMIFDEIDTGVSGRAAQKIAEKISKISKKYQVLCITHLAQIACMADVHFLIEKNDVSGRASTTVSDIDGEARVLELARIIGGAEITDITKKNAEEMLELASKFNVKE